MYNKRLIKIESKLKERVMSPEEIIESLPEIPGEDSMSQFMRILRAGVTLEQLCTMAWRDIENERKEKEINSVKS